MENKFAKGDKIEYAYDHHINRKSVVEITKRGVFVRLITPKKLFLADWNVPQKAVVLLEGNKNASTVDISKLKKLPNHDTGQ